MTAEDFDAAIARFEKVGGGELRVTDIFPHGRPPYRSGYLTVRVPREVPQHLPNERVVELVGQLAILAVEVGAYLTMSVHITSIWLQLQLVRDLDLDEIGDDPPVATREVMR